MKKKLQLAIGFLISGIFVAYAFHNMDLATLKNSLVQLQWGWATLFAITTIGTFYWRAWRWQKILQPQRSIPVHRLFGPVMIGFAFNNLFPFRVGEIARPLALQKTERIPFPAGLSSIVVERIFDVVTLLCLLAVSPYFVHLDPSISQEWNGFKINSDMINHFISSGSKAVIVLLICLCMAIIDPIREWGIGLVLRLPVKEAWKTTIRNIATNATEGLRAVRDPWLLAQLLFHSAAIWGLSGATYVIMSRAFPGIPQLTYVEAMAFLVITCAVITVPAAPGFWGVFEIGGLLALQLTGVVGSDARGRSLATAFTVLLHVIQWVSITAVGLWYAARTQVSVGDAKAAKSPEAAG